MTTQTLVGQTIANYQLEAILGRGGMAVVYRAKHEEGHTMALKVLNLPQSANQDLTARFRREATTAARLNHPGIVPVLDFGQTEGYLYLAMPVIEGQTLANYLKVQGRLSEEEAVDIAWQLTDALAYAHEQGVVHRDVKPSNILLTPAREVKLTDFGVALALDDPSLTRTGHTIGTPAYMAPEQASGTTTVDGRTDLYSIGVVLYQMVTGRLPFQGNTPQLLYAHVHEAPPPPSTIIGLSAGVEAIILQALTKPVGQRFQNGAALARALNQVETNTPTLNNLSPDITVQLPITKQSKWFWWFSGLIGGGSLFLLLMGGGLLLWQQNQPLSTVIPTLTTTPSPTATFATFASPKPSATATTVSATATVTTLPNLPYPPGSLLQSTGDAVFRLRTNGRLQHIYDWPTFLEYGFKPDDIQQVDGIELGTWFEGDELTRLVIAEDGVLDWIAQGQRWRIKRWQADLAETGHHGLPASQADPLLLALVPLTIVADELPLGTLIQEGENHYRLFEDGVLRRLRSSQLLAEYGYETHDFIKLPNEVRHLYRNGQPLTEFLKGDNDSVIYRISEQQRIPISTIEEFYGLGYGDEDISLVPVTFLNSFPIIEQPPTISPTPTEPLPVIPTNTPYLCTIAVAEGFQSTNNLVFFEALGCPMESPVSTGAAWQSFERGLMLWRRDNNLIYIITESGVEVMGDNWRENIDLIFDATINPPEGLHQPVRGFGKLWREQLGVRDNLGWATAEEEGIQAAIQPFEHGFAWRNETGELLILFLETGGYVIEFPTN